MIDRSRWKRVVWLCVTLIIIASVRSQPVHAASLEQIKQSCLQALMPQIMACAQTKELRGNPQAVKEQCGRGQVRACVMRQEQKEASGKAAPAAPKADSDVAPAAASAVQPGFVAPPRTIADITAVLDSEKPDEATIAKRKAEADAPPPALPSPYEMRSISTFQNVTRVKPGAKRVPLDRMPVGLSAM